MILKVTWPDGKESYHNGPIEIVDKGNVLIADFKIEAIPEIKITI